MEEIKERLERLEHQDEDEDKGEADITCEISRKFKLQKSNSVLKLHVRMTD